MFIKRFEEINKDMFHECGGKAANLGELTCLGLNVPKGFCVIAKAFDYHLYQNNLYEKIETISKGINFDEMKDLEEKTKLIRSLIEQAPIPCEIEREIIKNYKDLSMEKEPFVAIRSSVAVKESQISSFPGMMDTYHYVFGNHGVIENVKRCWASLWSSRATFTRHNKGIDHSKAIIAPTVQLMVNSEISGVLFTINPVSGEKEEIVIESNWGLGESVVSGRCLCDFYIVDKKNFKLKIKKIPKKEQAFIRAEGGGGKWAYIDPERAKKETLNEKEVEELCMIGCKIEQHYCYPQDIEWAYEGGIPYILQARRAKVGGE